MFDVAGFYSMWFIVGGILLDGEWKLDCRAKRVDVI